MVKVIDKTILVPLPQKKTRLEQRGRWLCFPGQEFLEIPATQDYRQETDLPGWNLNLINDQAGGEGGCSRLDLQEEMSSE